MKLKQLVEKVEIANEVHSLSRNGRDCYYVRIDLGFANVRIETMKQFNKLLEELPEEYSDWLHNTDFKLDTYTEKRTELFGLLAVFNATISVEV